MALNIVNRINNKLKCINALILPHFNYAWSAWYLNLTKKLKHRIQTTLNKCMFFAYS